MISKRIAEYLAAAFLVLSTGLAAANWYVRPGRSAFWCLALLLIGCMVYALLRVSGGAGAGPVSRQLYDSITSGVVYGGGVLVIALSGKLALNFGLVGKEDLTWRILMALLGAFLIFAGNGVPKALRPLMEMRCDPVKVQAFQRFGGWAWVLAGFAIVFAWLLLPITAAQKVTSVLLPTTILLIVIQWFRVRRSRLKPTI